jgi:Tol biopolymer transport system component
VSKRRRTGIALAASAFAVAIAAASSESSTRLDHGFASPTWSPDGKKLAFVEWRTVTGDGSFVTHGTLYTMNADGSGVRKLIPERAFLGEPTWSPDASKIAFCICAAGGIYVVDADGRRPRQLDGDGSHSPAWSPGGRKIAYIAAALDDYQGSVMVMNPDGTHKTVAASYDDQRAFLDPAWSPDGERLAFTATDAPDVGAHIVPYLAYVANYNTDEPRVNVLSRAQARGADWSPDGRKILFTFNGTVRVLDVRKQRTAFLHDGSDADWSPDGRRIAFVGRDRQMYTMTPNGSSVRPLAPH